MCGCRSEVQRSVVRSPVPWNKFELIDDGCNNIDPNDEDQVMPEGCNGGWLKGTWEELYLHPKY